jgi:xylan 1,4-beta-xylosidase
MLPVSWTQGWPSILPTGAAVPYSVESPNGISRDVKGAAALSGNFTWRDDFRDGTLSRLWMGLRTLPDVSVNNGLRLEPRTEKLWGDGNPAFICRRVQHTRFSATTSVELPAGKDVSVGLVAFQNESHHYFLGIHRSKEGIEAFVECVNEGPPRFLVRTSIAAPSRLGLRIDVDGAACDFAYSTSAGAWKTLLEGANAALLSTDIAGGFVGAVVGLHARIDP